MYQTKKTDTKVLYKILYILIFTLFLTLWLYENISSVSRSNERFTIKKYLDDPEKWGDKKNIEKMGFIVNISSNHFYFDWDGTMVKVQGSGVEKAVLGETIVLLNFNKDGTIELVDYHNYDYNYVLYALSFLALIIAMVIFFKEWKFTRRGFEDA